MSKVINFSMDWQYVRVKIEGTAPLIMNKFPEETKDDMLNKHLGNKGSVRKAKDLDKAFNNAIHYLSDGKTPGFVARAFKSCMYEGWARHKSKDLAMKDIVRFVRIVPTEQETNMVKIHGVPKIRIDIKTNANGSPDTRIRAEFPVWSAEFEIQFLKFSPQQIVTAINEGGFVCGIGDERPNSRQSKTGSFGTFKVVYAEEVVQNYKEVVG